MPTQLFPAPAGQHDISEADAKQMIRDYQATIPSGSQNDPGIIGGVFDISAINDISSQPEVMGLRYYYGYDSTTRQRTLILVGTDQYGDDTNFTAVLRERAFTAPPYGGSL
jgi:hypothetical protein